jgi:hypothetical protein
MIIIIYNLIIIVSNMNIIASTMIILAGWTAGCGAGGARHHYPGTGSSTVQIFFIKQFSAVLWIRIFRIWIQDAN